jgi:hypothetical protein
MPRTFEGGVHCEVVTVAEEADETVFWLEMLADCEIVPTAKIEPSLKESRELAAIFSASQRTARIGN